MIIVKKTAKSHDILRKHLEKVALLAAEEVKSISKSIAPVDTGAMRDSIDIKRELDEYIIGTNNIPYAIYQEYGTRLISPRAFMRRALDIVIKKFNK